MPSPFTFQPRPYQKAALNALFEMRRDAEGKVHMRLSEKIHYLYLEWSRRLGKDTTLLRAVALSAHLRVGNYYYNAPDKAMIRDIVWQGKDDQGVPMLAAFPDELVSKRNDTRMEVHYKNGSIIKFDGVNDPEFVVGPNPVGVVFTEWSLCDPKAWSLYLPIIVNNKGWAAFAYTPKAKGPHADEMFSKMSQESDWFCQSIGPLEAKDPQGVRYWTDEKIAKLKAGGMTEATIQREIWLRKDAPEEGATYAKEIFRATVEGRIKDVPYDPKFPVHTGWDLGHDDSTSVWFFQMVGNAIHFIDFFELWGKYLVDAVGECKQRYGNYDYHFAPHDIEVHDWGSVTRQSRRQTAADMGFMFKTTPRTPVEEGIDAVRTAFPRMYFDKRKCAQGLKRLGAYSENDSSPKDANRHAADAMRTLCQNLPRVHDPQVQLPSITADWNPTEVDSDLQKAESRMRVVPVVHDFDPLQAER